MRQHNRGYLSPNDWVLLLNKAQSQTFRLGDEIIRAGSQVEHIYVIRSGSATVELPTARSSAVLAVLEEGEVCGELAFLGNGTANASVIAKDFEVKIDAIAVHDLRNLCQEIPGFGLRLFQSLAGSLARRLKDTSAELVRALNSKEARRI
jgi:CRP-like cAMP-binding protein